MANDEVNANSSDRVRAYDALNVPAIIFGMLSKRCVMYPSVVCLKRMRILVFLRSIREISFVRLWATVQKKAIFYFFPAVSLIDHQALCLSWRTRRGRGAREALEVIEFIITRRRPVASSSDRGVGECDLIFLPRIDGKIEQSRIYIYLTNSVMSTLPVSTAQVRQFRYIRQTHLLKTAAFRKHDSIIINGRAIFEQSRIN